MRHRTTAGFWKRFDSQTEQVQKLARKNYRLLEDDPLHPSLHFKALADHDPPLWSVRVGRSYRALAIEEGGVLYWFWIGSHAEYDRIVG